LTNAGTIIGNSGIAVLFGGTGSNRLVLDPGGGFSGTVVGSTSIGASNTLELASAASAGTLSGLGTEFTNFGPIVFDTGADWSISGNTAGLAGTISGFAQGDTIEITGFEVSRSIFSGGVLALQSGTGDATLDLPGVISTAHFDVTRNSAGTEVTIACFRDGTRILTASGGSTVENLRIGDLVVTRSGQPRPIKWIGHRHVDCRRHPRPEEVWPVRICPDAFGSRKPRRDLWLSPDHAVFIEGVLTPIRYLINGATIVQEPLDSVTYWHVELDRHDVILAEGLSCESYLDTGNRGAFANGGPAVQMHADFAMRIWDNEACAKLVLSGPRLAAARRRLLKRSEALGFATADDPALHLTVDDKPIEPRVIAGGMHRFALPADARVAGIISRSGVPAEIGATASDRRRLGVMVERIILRQPGRSLEIPLDTIPMDDGFYPLEHEAERRWRWTNGNARLTIPNGFAHDGTVLVDLHIVAAQTSWVRVQTMKPGNSTARKAGPTFKAA
jgi:hypothetical protein